jgi:hypothetical protein
LGIDISAHHWFLLVARPSRVFKAAAALQERGLVTALPYEWRSRRRNSRHCKSVRRFPEAQLGPYLLTGFPSETPAWRTLFGDPRLEPLLSGVVSVTSDGMPSPVRSAEIIRQEAQYGAELYELPPPSALSDADDDQLQLAVGDRARIGTWRRWSRGEEEFDEGGFVGKLVTVSKIEGAMVKVLLPMFGIERHVIVPMEKLAAA